MNTDDQPTMEQSLHSIALSLIELNKGLRDTRRTQLRTFRLTKQETVRISRVQIVPPKPSIWVWGLKSFFNKSLKRG